MSISRSRFLLGWKTVSLLRESLRIKNEQFNIFFFQSHVTPGKLGAEKSLHVCGDNLTGRVFSHIKGKQAGQSAPQCQSKVTGLVLAHKRLRQNYPFKSYSIMGKSVQCVWNQNTNFYGKFLLLFVSVWISLGKRREESAYSRVRLRCRYWRLLNFNTLKTQHL